jgi:hypothetical protein
MTKYKTVCFLHIKRCDMTINKVTVKKAVADLTNLMNNVMDLDDLAKIYSLYISNDPVQVFEQKEDDEGSSIFENGNPILNKTAKD